MKYKLFRKNVKAKMEKMLKSIITGIMMKLVNRLKKYAEIA